MLADAAFSDNFDAGSGQTISRKAVRAAGRMSSADTVPARNSGSDGLTRQAFVI